MGGGNHRDYPGPPSALRYMAGAVLPGRRPGPFPPISAAWRGFGLASDERAALLAAAGSAATPLLAPHVVGFRLLMALLTRPAFPLSIGRALQVRNHMVLRRPLREGEAGELSSVVVGQRVLEKGAEVDVRTVLRAGAEVVLRAEAGPGGTTFALEVEGDPRPAVLGSWGPAGPGEAP